MAAKDSTAVVSVTIRWRSQMSPLSSKLAAIALALLLSACSTRPVEEADLVMLGGKVFTAEDSAVFAEAIAILGERIVAVGSDIEIEALAGDETLRIDLGGRVVVPGINDAHRHFSILPAEVRALPLRPLEPSWENTTAAITAAVAEAPPGTHLYGIVGATVVTDPAVDRAALDRLAPEHPVTLAAFYGHGEIWNTRALAEYGVGDEEADPAGGFYERKAGSQLLNGRSWEYAHWGPQRRFQERAGDERIVHEIENQAAVMLELGITSIQNMPLISLQRYVSMLGVADIPLRVRAIRFPMTTVEGRDLDEDRDVVVPESIADRVTVSGVKWIVDGTPLERGSPLRQPYSDEPTTSGRLNFPPGEVAAILREAVDAEERLLLHAVGDRALEVVFDAMDAMAGVDWPAQRVRIEHGDGIDGDLIERAASLGVIVVQNPTHFSFAEIFHQRFGPERRFSRMRSLIDVGVTMAIGSDGPPNPWLDVMLAAIHPTHPSEAISVEEAVRLYTANAALAEDQEHEKGTIVVGKLADVAVLSQDVFEIPIDQIVATRSVLTVIGGAIVHDAGVLD